MTTKENSYIYYITSEILGKHGIDNFFHNIQTLEYLQTKIPVLQQECRTYFGDESVSVELTDELLHAVLIITDSEGSLAEIPINVLDYKEIPFKACFHYFYELTNEIYKVVVEDKVTSDGDAVLKFINAFNTHVKGRCKMCQHLIRLGDIIIKEKMLVIEYIMYTCSRDKEYEKALPFLKVSVECPLV